MEKTMSGKTNTIYGRALAVLFLLMVFFFSVINVPVLKDSFVKAAEAAEKPAGPETENRTADTGASYKAALRSVEEYLLENIKTKYFFVNLHGAYRRLLGNRHVNGTVRLNNDYLAFSYYRYNQEDHANAIIRLNEYLAEKGIKFLYVGVPGKLDPDKAQLPYYITDYSNENQSDMLSRLEEGGVSTMDLRPAIKDSSKDWYDLFFVTDHHWTAEGGFLAYTAIARHLNELYGYELDRHMTLDDFSVVSYDKIFLGSHGKRVGLYFTRKGADDFHILIPEFDTEMSLDVPKNNEHREGTFEDVIFFRPRFDKNYFYNNCFTGYIGGDFPFVIQKNETAVNPEKLLIVKDSYTLAVQPYLSFMFREVDTIDLRTFKDDLGTLVGWIEANSPDIVLMQYSPPILFKEEVFEFGLD